VLQVCRYRTERGELLRYRIKPSGRTCCEVERSDDWVRKGHEIYDADVLFSDDPAWPGLDPRSLPSLLVVD